MTCSCTSRNDSRFFLLVRGERNIKFNTQNNLYSSVEAVHHSRQPEAWRKKFKFYFLAVCASKKGSDPATCCAREQNINVVQSCTRLAPSMSSVATKY